MHLGARGGRDGHIECSAMINQYLGDRIDIHGGGKDSIFPHHESEIAQSESFTGRRPFTRYFMDTAMVMVLGREDVKVAWQHGLCLGPAKEVLSKCHKMGAALAPLQKGMGVRWKELEEAQIYADKMEKALKNVNKPIAANAKIAAF